MVKVHNLGRLWTFIIASVACIERSRAKHRRDHKLNYLSHLVGTPHDLGQLSSPPLVFDIITPNANLIDRKSQLPQYPEDLPLCILEKTIA